MSDNRQLDARSILNTDEGDSDTVFGAFIVRVPDSENGEANSPHWGVVTREKDKTLKVKVVSASTQRRAFYEMLRDLNLSTDANFVLPFTATDEE